MAPQVFLGVAIHPQLVGAVGDPKRNASRVFLAFNPRDHRQRETRQVPGPSRAYAGWHSSPYLPPLFTPPHTAFPTYYKH